MPPRLESCVRLLAFQHNRNPRGTGEPWAKASDVKLTHIWLPYAHIAVCSKGELAILVPISNICISVGTSRKVFDLDSALVHAHQLSLLIFLFLVCVRRQASDWPERLVVLPIFASRLTGRHSVPHCGAPFISAPPFPEFGLCHCVLFPNFQVISLHIPCQDLRPTRQSAGKKTGHRLRYLTQVLRRSSIATSCPAKANPISKRSRSQLSSCKYNAPPRRAIRLRTRGPFPGVMGRQGSKTMNTRKYLRGERLTLAALESGGLEMLFSYEKRHSLSIPAINKDGKPFNIACLIEHLCENLLTDRKELFVLEDHL
jgi:hypothetical protein